jgi:dihydropteroate synthase
MPDPFLKYGSKTYIMGILNVTPDSFSGDGLMAQKDVVKAAIDQALQFVESGADILDIGGESTRPGGLPVSESEELERVLPVIESLAKLNLDVLLSVDTSKAVVASASLQAGAHWINDVWSLRADENMVKVAAESGAPIVLMHNRSRPNQVSLQERLGGQYIGAEYGDVVKDVSRELMESVNLALKNGVKREQIILDPGLGFGKKIEHNLELVARLDEIKALGYPVLLGPSRKSFIGYTLDLPPDQRVEGTAAICAIAVTRGVDILRVHDVAAIARVARMSDAVIRTKGMS